MSVQEFPNDILNSLFSLIVKTPNNLSFKDIYTLLTVNRRWYNILTSKDSLLFWRDIFLFYFSYDIKEMSYFDGKTVLNHLKSITQIDQVKFKRKIDDDISFKWLDMLGYNKSSGFLELVDPADGKNMMKLRTYDYHPKEITVLTTDKYLLVSSLDGFTLYTKKTKPKKFIIDIGTDDGELVGLTRIVGDHLIYNIALTEGDDNKDEYRHFRLDLRNPINPIGLTKCSCRLIFTKSLIIVNHLLSDDICVGTCECEKFPKMTVIDLHTWEKKEFVCQIPSKEIESYTENNYLDNYILRMFDNNHIEVYDIKKEKIIHETKINTSCKTINKVTKTNRYFVIYGNDDLRGYLTVFDPYQLEFIWEWKYKIPIYDVKNLGSAFYQPFKILLDHICVQTHTQYLVFSASSGTLLNVYKIPFGECSFDFIRIGNICYINKSYSHKYNGILCTHPENISTTTMLKTIKVKILDKDNIIGRDVENGFIVQLNSTKDKIVKVLGTSNDPNPDSLSYLPLTDDEKKFLESMKIPY